MRFYWAITTSCDFIVSINPINNQILARRSVIRKLQVEGGHGGSTNGPQIIRLAWCFLSVYMFSATLKWYVIFGALYFRKKKTHLQGHTSHTSIKLVAVLKHLNYLYEISLLTTKLIINFLTRSPKKVGYARRRRYLTPFGRIRGLLGSHFFWKVW